MVRLRDEVCRGADDLPDPGAALARRDRAPTWAGGQPPCQIPAPLSPETTARVRELAVRAFKAIDCAGMARVDFFIEASDRVLVNEINTIPGFTATSAYPRRWEATGLPY